MNTEKDEIAAESNSVEETKISEVKEETPQVEVNEENVTNDNVHDEDMGHNDGEEGAKNEGKGKSEKKAKGKRRMRKGIKITLIIVAVLVGLFLLLAAIISPVAHWYIEKHSKELCGRVVTMDDLHINLFTGTIEIEGLTMLEQNDKDTCMSFERLYVDMSLWQLISKTVRVDEITLEKPMMVVVQNKDRFNFTDICEFFKSEEEEEEKESNWVVDLRKITVTEGKVIYRDADVGNKFVLNQLAVKVPRIYFNTEKTDLGIDLKFDDGGDLNVKLLYGMESSEYDLSVNLTNFDLNGITPYLCQFLNIKDFKGRLNAKLNVTGKTDHILDVMAKGDVTVTDVLAMDNNDKRLVEARCIAMEGIDFNTQTRDYHLKRLKMVGVNFDYEIFADHRTFDNLFVENIPVEEEDEEWVADYVDEEAFSDDDYVSEDDIAEMDMEEVDVDESMYEGEGSPDLHLLVDEFIITESSVNYIDHTMRQEVRIPISQIDIRCNNFDPDAPIGLTLKAIVGEGGNLMAKCEGSLSDFSNMKLDVFLKNFKLTDASPYSVEYLAYPISDGVLSFASTNTLVNDIISSQNKVDIYNCKVDKKLESVKAEYNIPMRAAVYILTDRKGNIQLDLPVSGNINDPTFSYRKIIFKTLCNLIVKVVAAPVDFLVKAINGEPDLFDDMAYDIRPQGLGSESSDRLNKIADAMKEKPELHLTIQQSVDIEENINEYALFNAQKEFYMQKHPGQLTMEDYDNIRSIKSNNKDFVEYVNSRLPESSDLQADIYTKCVAIYDQSVLRQQINANIEKRNQQIVNHLITQGISRSRIEVLSLGNKKTPKGKTLVSFSVRMPEE